MTTNDGRLINPPMTSTPKRRTAAWQSSVPAVQQTCEDALSIAAKHLPDSSQDMSPASGQLRRLAMDQITGSQQVNTDRTDGHRAEKSAAAREGARNMVGSRTPNASVSSTQTRPFSSYNVFATGVGRQ